jgi:hypothetical protein
MIALLSLPDRKLPGAPRLSRQGVCEPATVLVVKEHWIGARFS